MYPLMRAVVRILARVILGRRLHIEGMDGVPRRGGVLVVGNHVGTVEPPLTGVHIPRMDVYYMAKSELFDNPVLGWLFRRNHTFPVVRDSADRGALRRALRILDGGHVLLVYPEGTRSWDGSTGQAHPGAGFIGRRSGALVVPVASWGSDRVIPKGKWLPRRADVHLRVGQGFRLPERGGDGRPLSNQAAVNLMMARVTELLPPTVRDPGLPGRGRAGAA